SSDVCSSDLRCGAAVADARARDVPAALRHAISGVREDARLREESGRELADGRQVRELDRAAAVVARLDERVGDDRSVRLSTADAARDVGEAGHERPRDVRLDRVAERPKQPDRVVQEAAALDPVADRRQELLLARRAGEVVLAGGLANARERERLLAIEMVDAGGDA